MAWRDMTRDEQEAAMREQGKWAAPGSPAWEGFGLRYDRAAEEGAPFELTAGQVLAAGRLEMSPRAYAALLAVRNIDEHQQFQEAEAVRERALSELELEALKAKLRGAV
jgi:hypothetical protein